MDWLREVLGFIQHNKEIYLFCVAVLSGVIAYVVGVGQRKADQRREYEEEHGMPAAATKRKHATITLVLCILAALFPLFLSMYYPYLDESDAEITGHYDGYIKLSFYDASFAYRNYVGQEIFDDNDINSPLDRSYFNDSISPIVYITIINSSNQVVYDGRSEHMESCLIGIEYGTYTLIASCDNYQKYSSTITLTPDNKTTDVWKCKIYFVPDTYIATDVRIQVIAEDGIPYSNSEVSIGYPGHTLIEPVDESGIFNDLFILAKGEYLVYIESLDVYGRFIVNEFTTDGSIIVVTLS